MKTALLFSLIAVASLALNACNCTNKTACCASATAACCATPVCTK